MTKEKAVAILKQPDRVGCHLIKANDEESNKYNQESIEALNMAIKVLEQQPSDCVSLGVYDQVVWERDIAIEQLKELGYDFGEKIRTSDNCVSREEVLKPNKRMERLIPEGVTNGDMFKTVFPFISVKREVNGTSDNIVVRDNSFFGVIIRFHTDWWYTLYKGRER